ncbi:MAG: hypothetical protein WBR13_15710 [Allosphingosinicella sp.]
MKIRLAALLIVSGCAAPAPPGAIERSIDGVRVFERSGEGSNTLIVQDAIEWRGRFTVESGCLLLSIDGRDYTPIFASSSAARTALGDVGPTAPRLGASSWSLQGSRIPEADAAGPSKATGACGKPPFLVSSLSDPKPLPIARP